MRAGSSRVYSLRKVRAPKDAAVVNDHPGRSFCDDSCENIVVMNRVEPEEQCNRENVQGYEPSDGNGSHLGELLE